MKLNSSTHNIKTIKAPKECDDKISVEFSPFEIDYIARVFKRRAIGADNFDDGACWDLFKDAFSEWDKSREKTNDQKKNI